MLLSTLTSNRCTKISNVPLNLLHTLTTALEHPYFSLHNFYGPDVPTTKLPTPFLISLTHTYFDRQRTIVKFPLLIQSSPTVNNQDADKKWKSPSSTTNPTPPYYNQQNWNVLATHSTTQEKLMHSITIFLASDPYSAESPAPLSAIAKNASNISLATDTKPASLQIPAAIFNAKRCLDNNFPFSSLTHTLFSLFLSTYELSATAIVCHRISNHDCIIPFPLILFIDSLHHRHNFLPSPFSVHSHFCYVCSCCAICN